VAGLAQTPKINSLSNEAQPGTDISTLPQGNVLGAISVPLGITAEAELFPQTTEAGVTAKSWSLAAKWTFTDVFPLPVDLAAKAFYTDADFSFAGNVGTPSVYTTFNVTTKMLGAQVQVSKQFLGLLEPYLTLGYLQSAGQMDVNGSLQVFQNSLTDGQSASQTVSCIFYMAGLELNLPILRLGLEAGSIFGNTKGAAKLSLYF
jgi:hypothetical protein